ncbi:MAG: hypothetical protein Q8R00_01990 [Candidatus Nanoarchaeia archaeon]|nr:hypothetical protein [Candidatus Nanoarchaeia archaeon]
MVDIIKRIGKRQKFSVAKIKRAVEKAAKEAKVAKSKRVALAKEVSVSVVKALKGKRSIKATALRRAVLVRLDRAAKRVASAWRRYEKRKK